MATLVEKIKAARPNLKSTDFIDKELIHFSNSDTLRSIGSCIDGLKPWEERNWIGKVIKINDVSFKVEKNIPRCVAINLNPKRTTIH